MAGNQTLSPNTQITQENVVWTVGSWVSPKFDLSGRGERDTIKAGELVQITFVGDDGFAPVIRVCGMSKGWLCHAFTYIGPDLGDGWIGWSGGENPVPGAYVEVRFRSGSRSLATHNSEGWGTCWKNDDGPDDIIAFRPALSPPAEGEGQRIIDGLKDVLAGDVSVRAPTPGPVDWERVGPKLVEFVSDFAAQARVGYGGIPVIRSKRVNVPAALFHRAVALRDELAATQPEGK